MKKADAVVIGGGVSGLFTALELAKRGAGKVVVVEEGYLGCGSTLRCATGIRASFTSVEHVELMKRSIQLWKEYSKALGFRYRQGGYLWLASEPETVELFRELSKFHNSLGVPTRIIDADEIKELVPCMSVDREVKGLFDPIAGKADPFGVVYALARECRRLGVEIHDHTKALRLAAKDSKVVGVETSKGFIEAPVAVVAAGYGTRELLKTVGVDVPLEPVPHYALITERLGRAFDPLVIDWDAPGVPYIVQTLEGNLLMGAGVTEEPSTDTSLPREFLFLALRSWSKRFPWLSCVNVLRSWPGFYVCTPDKHPIYGPVGSVEGVYVAAGYSGHGFMMGPVTGEVIASWILDGKPEPRIAERLTIDRFEKGELVREKAIVG